LITPLIREGKVKRLDALFELSKDVHIHVFVECGGKSQVQIPRPVRRVVRTFAYFLGRLKQVRYDVTIIMNSSYVPVPAPIVNDVESRFSIVHRQTFRYTFTLQDNECATSGIERQLKQVCCVSF
jgi:hypothetical protein